MENRKTLYPRVQSSYGVIIASFGILLLLMALLFYVNLLFPSVEASSDYDIFEELDDYDYDSEEDFEEESTIKICCTWRDNLQDGILTYHIDYESSLEEQEAVRDALEEWDLKKDHLKIESVPRIENSDIRVRFHDETELAAEGEEIAGQTTTTFDQYGFLNKAEISISRSIQAYDFDTSTIEQIAKHEIGHALGLGHANFDGNLMAENVNDGTDIISDCEVKAVVEANYWKLGDKNDDDHRNDDDPNYDYTDDDSNTDLDNLQDGITTCEVDEERSDD
jgi:hypothetical protein